MELVILVENTMDKIFLIKEKTVTLVKKENLKFSKRMKFNAASFSNEEKLWGVIAYI